MRDLRFVIQIACVSSQCRLEWMRLATAGKRHLPNCVRVYGCRGVDVDFPYDAYPCQLEYMSKVIQALQTVCRDRVAHPAQKSTTAPLPFHLSPIMAGTQGV
jgi:hypothetical protein